MGTRGPKRAEPREIPNSLELCYFLGLVKGDGSIGVKDFYSQTAERMMVKVRIIYASKDLPLAESCKRTAESLGFKVRFRESKSYCRGKESPRPTYRLGIHNPGLVRWIANLSLVDIEKIATTSKDHSIAFIKGFYEAEGGASDPNNTSDLNIGIYNTDEELMKIVYRIILSLGFTTTKFKVREKHSSTTFGSAEGRKVYIVRICTSDEARKFIRIINPCVKREPRKWSYEDDETKNLSIPGVPTSIQSDEPETLEKG